MMSAFIVVLHFYYATTSEMYCILFQLMDKKKKKSVTQNLVFTLASNFHCSSPEDPGTWESWILLKTKQWCTNILKK